MTDAFKGQGKGKLTILPPLTVAAAAAKPTFSAPPNGPMSDRTDVRPRTAASRNTTPHYVEPLPARPQTASGSRPAWQSYGRKATDVTATPRPRNAGFRERSDAMSSESKLVRPKSAGLTRTTDMPKAGAVQKGVEAFSKGAPSSAPVDRSRIFTPGDFYYSETNPRYQASLQDAKYQLEDKTKGAKAVTPYDITLVKPDAIKGFYGFVFKEGTEANKFSHVHRRYHSSALLTSTRGGFRTLSDKFIAHASRTGSLDGFKENGFEEFEKFMEATSKQANTGDHMKDRDIIMAALKDDKPDVMNLALYLLKKSIQQSKVDLKSMPATAAKLLLKAQLKLIIDVITNCSAKEVILKTDFATSVVKAVDATTKKHNKDLASNEEVKYAKLVWTAQKTASPTGTEEMPYALLAPASEPFKSRVYLSDKDPAKITLESTVFSEAQGLATQDLESAILPEPGKKRKTKLKVNAGTGEGKTWWVKKVRECYGDKIEITMVDLHSTTEELDNLKTLEGKPDGKLQFVFCDEVFFYSKEFAKLATGAPEAEELSIEQIEKYKAKFITDLRKKGVVVAMVGASENPKIVELAVARHRRKMADHYQEAIKQQDIIVDPNQTEEAVAAAILVLEKEEAKIADRKRKIAYWGGALEGDEAEAGSAESVHERLLSKRDELGVRKLKDAKFEKLAKDEVAKYQPVAAKVRKKGKTTFYALPDLSTIDFTAENFKEICKGANEAEFVVVTPYKKGADQKLVFRAWYKDGDSVKCDEVKEGGLGAAYDKINAGKATALHPIVCFDQSTYIGGDVDRLARHDEGEVFLQCDPLQTKTQDSVVQAVGRYRGKDKTKLTLHVLSSENNLVDFSRKIDTNTKTIDDYKMAAYLEGKEGESLEKAKTELADATENARRLKKLMKDFEDGAVKREEDRIKALQEQLEKDLLEADRIREQAALTEAQTTVDAAARLQDIARKQQELETLEQARAAREAALKALEEAQGLEQDARIKQMEEEVQARLAQLEEEARILKQGRLEAERRRAQELEELKRKHAQELEEAQRKSSAELDSAKASRTKDLAEQERLAKEHLARLQQSAKEALRQKEALETEARSEMQAKKDAAEREAKEAAAALEAAQEKAAGENPELAGLQAEIARLAAQRELNEAQAEYVGRINKASALIAKVAQQVGVLPNIKAQVDAYQGYISGHKDSVDNAENLLASLEVLSEELEEDRASAVEAAKAALEAIRADVDKAKTAAEVRTKNDDTEAQTQAVDALSTEVDDLLKRSLEQLKESAASIKMPELAVDAADLEGLDAALLEAQAKLANAATTEAELLEQQAQKALVLEAKRADLERQQQAAQEAARKIEAQKAALAKQAEEFAALSLDGVDVPEIDFAGLEARTETNARLIALRKQFNAAAQQFAGVKTADIEELLGLKAELVRSNGVEKDEEEEELEIQPDDDALAVIEQIDKVLSAYYAARDKLVGSKAIIPTLTAETEEADIEGQFTALDEVSDNLDQLQELDRLLEEAKEALRDDQFEMEVVEAKELTPKKTARAASAPARRTDAKTPPPARPATAGAEPKGADFFLSNPQGLTKALAVAAKIQHGEQSKVVDRAYLQEASRQDTVSSERNTIGSMSATLANFASACNKITKALDAIIDQKNQANYNERLIASIWDGKLNKNSLTTAEKSAVLAMSSALNEEGNDVSSLRNKFTSLQVARNTCKNSENLKKAASQAFDTILALDPIMLEKWFKEANQDINLNINKALAAEPRLRPATPSGSPALANKAPYTRDAKVAKAAAAIGEMQPSTEVATSLVDMVAAKKGVTSRRGRTD